MIHLALYSFHIFSYSILRYPATYNPNCSLIDTRTILSYSFLFSLYNLQQSMLAPLSKLGSIMCRMIRSYSNQYLNIYFILPASMEITLKMTFSTLCTGLHRSDASSYMVGSSPGVCKIDMQTFPSGYTSVLFLVSRLPQEEVGRAELTIGMEQGRFKLHLERR